MAGKLLVVADVGIEGPQLGLRERKKRQTRELIAGTARRLFAEHGFEGVTVAAIARAADVSEQTVFNYFPTKEDLVYWQFGAFEDQLLATVRDRPPGESALTAFRRFILGQRGLLGRVDEKAREELAALTRTITESPALLAREQQIFARYTASLARLLAQEAGGADDVDAWVAASALMGVHRTLVDYSRRRILAGARHPALARDVRARAERAFALLEHGLGDYAVKAG
jgi:AcrR family transcriptional regulator